MNHKLKYSTKRKKLVFNRDYTNFTRSVKINKKT